MNGVIEAYSPLITAPTVFDAMSGSNPIGQVIECGPKQMADLLRGVGVRPGEGW